ncbi:MAG: 50S ribosomal protein L27 [Candidatus Pacebacteria bacterium]|nr:50S ribosomal protein L27 [Candidatus Paceibacterota bacterium]
MAKTKASGVTGLGRDSLPKYLGIKLFDGQKAKPGQILVRQRGTRFIAGENVAMGNDNTLYAKKAGTVHFITKRITHFDRSKKVAKIVNLKP